MPRWIAVLCLLGCAATAPAEDAPPAPATSEKDQAAQLVESMRSKDAGPKIDAATKAKELQHPSLTAPLVSLLGDESYTVRRAAIEALGARTDADARKKAAEGLAARLPKLAKKLDSGGEIVLVATALHDLAQPCAIDELVADIEIDTPLDVVTARVMAIANVPTADAIETLINLLSRAGHGAMAGHRGLIRNALRYATGVELAGDPDAWRGWWKDAKKDFDFEGAAERRAAERAKKQGREGRKKKPK